MPQNTEPSPEERLRAAYETAESRTAKAFEDAVATASFGGLLARSAENVAALTRLGSDAADLVLRNLRLAGRADITRLARQLHRTEDKLERVLQEVEALRDELARRDGAARTGSPAGRGRSGGRGGSAGEPDDGGAPAPGGRGARATGAARSTRSAPQGRAVESARTAASRRRAAK